MAEIKYIIGFTKGWEGGLTNNPDDSASKNPSPYEYKGQKGWHTNKGVTYAVFKANATKLGYQDTAQNFLTMPDDIWLKIAKMKYWDILGLDTVKSQSVANVMFSWQWGSGYAWVPRVSKYFAANGITWIGGNWVGKTFKLAPDFGQISQKLNELIDKVGEQKAFEDLIEQKREFLMSLKGTKSNPVTAAKPDGVFTKGWMNRLNDLKTYSGSLLGKAAQATVETVKNANEVVKKNPLKTIAFVMGISIAIYYGVKLIAIKK